VETPEQSMPANKSLPAGQRRPRAMEERRHIVEESLAPGARVALVAQAHGVHVSQLYHWRKPYRQGLLEPGNNETPHLLPVRVVTAAKPTARSASIPTWSPLSGVIQVELPKAHLSIAGRVDAEALRTVLARLLR
jgi:transposase